MRSCSVVLGILVLAGCLAGCGKQQDDLADAAKEVRNAAYTVWDEASDRAAALTKESSIDSLEDARKELVKLKKTLQPGKKLDEANAELDRLDAAIDIQKAKEAMSLTIGQVKKGAKALKKKADEVGNTIDDKLKQADDSFQLSERLQKAEDLYKDKSDEVLRIRAGV